MERGKWRGGAFREELRDRGGGIDKGGREGEGKGKGK